MGFSMNIPESGVGVCSVTGVGGSMDGLVAGKGFNEYLTGALRDASDRLGACNASDLSTAVSKVNGGISLPSQGVERVASSTVGIGNGGKSGDRGMA